MGAGEADRQTEIQLPTSLAVLSVGLLIILPPPDGTFKEGFR
jgi:hypothetical protein